MALQLSEKVTAWLEDLGSAEKFPRLNIYTCRSCRGHIVTSDLVPGVTPLMVGCQVTSDCKGMMQSSMYRVFDQTMLPSHEWHRPASLDGLSAWEVDHVKQGGLLLRKAQHD